MIKERGLIYLVTFASFGGNLLVVIGSWMITAPDPSGIGEDKYGTVRKVIRVTLLIGLADTLLSMAYRRTMASPDVLLVFNTLQILAAGIGFVGRVAQLQYYEKMAMRIPEPRLSSRAGFLKKVLPASYLLMTILGHLMTQFTPKAKRVPGSAWATFAGLGCFSIIVLLAVMIFAIMYLLMVDKFRKRFSEQAILAGQNWATHVPSPTTPQV